MAAALITGNTVVLKGATVTPWAGRLLADCIRDAGLPPGVFNYLSGSSGAIGAALVGHPLTAGVTFTGSYEVGRQIALQLQAGAYPRPCIAEMGGKNACIVTAGADLKRAAAGIVRSAFGMGGQKCSALSRLYVDTQVAGPLTEALLAQLTALAIGDPARRENWLGPVATQSGYDDYARYAAQLRTGGARILAGGERLADGALARGLFVRPTLAEAPVGHALWDKEMFLPILMLHRVTSNDEAMAARQRLPARAHGRLLRRARRGRLVPGAHRGRRHLREPPAGRDYRRVARLPALRRLERLGHAPARPSPPSITCRSTCASSRRPWSSESCMPLLPLQRSDREPRERRRQRGARGLHAPDPFCRRSRDHPSASGAICT